MSVGALLYAVAVVRQTRQEDGGKILRVVKLCAC